ncbi:ATP-grasp domain-containing protein [Salidesulfovibrio onnuriiensis]|uniref:ATP-grasp domain-containing protein n=1 Tax=Salidesulfovibrio onnuriiensis TaxID=2583823 RepID=UPI0011CB38DC|nr:ATP-grasp domain-containing protein [Salidesulfovibrio onnuriiensis]
MSEKLTVMVTGIGGGGHGEQILKALQLAETPYEIVGGDMSPCSKGLAEVDHPYILPPATAPDYVDALLRVCRKHGVKALFHGSEPELKAFAANRERIEAEGIFLPINPTELIEVCMDKFKTFHWLTEHGFHMPQTVQIENHEQLRAVDFFPAVLKPSVGGGGSANIYLAQTREEVDFLGTWLLDNLGPFIVQEYVGTVESEFTVGVLCDMDGNFINSIAVKRAILSGLSNRIKTANRTGNQGLGATLAISSGVSQGEIGPYPEVTADCERIALEMGCRGAINIQCRHVDGKDYIFEINPRFSGTTSLRAMVGYNEPDILIRKHVLGEDVEPRFAYKSGTIMRGVAETLVEGRNIPHA